MAQKGFTLIELMVTLAVMAVLLGLAAPNFAQLIRDNRATTEINAVAGMLNFARREAVQRAQKITLKGPAAADASWQVLRTSDSLELRWFPALTTFGVDPEGVQTIVFDSQGRLDDDEKLSLDLQVIDTELDCATYNRSVSVELSGAVSIKKAGC